MSKRPFVDLREHIGAIKHSYDKRDPFIFGLIVSVADTDDSSKNRLVRFRQEGQNEVCELRIAAFERENGIIAEIDQQFM